MQKCLRAGLTRRHLFFSESLQVHHAAHFGRGSGHRAQLDFIGTAAHHERHGLAGRKGRLIGQLQRLPIFRYLTEAVEHGSAACGEVQRERRGIRRILTVEGRCKAAAADRLAVAPGSEAHAQGIELVGGG